MLKYRLYILAAFYIIITLVVFSIVSSRGCYIHPNTDTTMPQLNPSSFYYIGKQFNTIQKLKHGDIVLYTLLGSEDPPVPARIIAMPGETLQIEDGNILINGIKKDKIIDMEKRLEQTTRLPKVTIPKDFLYVLPDSRAGLRDTDLEMNFIHIHQVKGKFLSSMFKSESL